MTLGPCPDTQHGTRRPDIEVLPLSLMPATLLILLVLSPTGELLPGAVGGVLGTRNPSSSSQICGQIFCRHRITVVSPTALSMHRDGGSKFSSYVPP